MSTDPEPADAPAELDRSKPPFLRRVRIRGYKSIAFCDVTLEPLTILVGRNASGKSNFLDALAFLRDVVKFGVSEAVKRHGGSDAVLCQTQENRIVSIEISCAYLIGKSRDYYHGNYHIDIELLKYQSAKIRREELRINHGTWWLGYTNEDGRVNCRAANDISLDALWHVKNRPFFDSYRDSPVPEFLDSLEAITSYNFNPVPLRLPQKPDRGVWMEKDGSNLASVIETTSELDPWMIERAGQYLSAITGSVEFAGVMPIGGFETLRFRVIGDEKTPPLEFDASSMSDGTLRAFAALVASVQMAPPHGSPSLVAIEEPETALHPAAMNALVDALDEATLRTQILLTTHSAEMLDNRTIQPKNVRVVQMIDGRTVIGPVDEASVEIVRRNLNTLGGLERENQLEADLDDQDRQQQLRQAVQESPG